MRPDTMPLDATLYEGTQHGTTDFPIQFYVDELHLFQNRQVPLHWHFEPEFFVIRDAAIQVQVGHHLVPLNPGEGIFISSNTLHRFQQIGEAQECLCPNIVFSAEMIAPHASMIHEKYITPLLDAPDLPYIVLSPKSAWQKEILERLDTVFALLQDFGPKGVYEEFPYLSFGLRELNSQGYEMQVQRELSEAWQLLFAHRNEVPRFAQDKKAILAQIRLQQMIAYIRENYRNPVTLQDIMLSANISKSEAARCFQAYTSVSPIEYLLQYRVKMAQRLLHLTTQSVQEVSLECGFRSLSYFIKAFRERAGVTPGEYRRNIGN